jgi:hypothetical protein
MGYILGLCHMLNRCVTRACRKEDLVHYLAESLSSDFVLLVGSRDIIIDARHTFERLRECRASV